MIARCGFPFTPDGLLLMVVGAFAVGLVIGIVVGRATR